MKKFKIIEEHVSEEFEVEAENMEEMSKAIEYMIENDEFREKLSKNAVINSERFRNEKIGNEWKELFEKIVKKTV